MAARNVASVLVVSGSILLAHARAQTCGTTQLVGPGGTPADNYSEAPQINADGRYVVFTSYATVFVPGATLLQTYLFDRANGSYELISKNASGAPATYTGSNVYGRAVDISNDGRFVSFQSNANNLAPNDTNGVADLFVRDRLSNQLLLPATTPAGTTLPAGSGGGSMTSDATRILIITSYAFDPGDTNGVLDVYVYERLNGTRTLATVAFDGSPANAYTGHAAISADGRYVAFDTGATNVVPNDTNGFTDVFVRDLLTGTNERISVGIGGSQPNASCSASLFSADGRYVAFSSGASNLVPGGLGGWSSPFVRDRALATTVQVNLTPGGTQSVGPHARALDISGDGRYVAFVTEADDILPGDNNAKDDIYLRDLWTATTTLVSAKPGGGVSNANSSGPAALSADGRVITFLSQSPSLTSPPISNGYADVFVRACTPVGPSVYCIAQVASNGCVPSIGGFGNPSASSPSGFDIASVHTLNNKFGTLFYGTQGSTLAPFYAGWLCVRPPVRRTGLQFSNGNAPPDDCSGTFHFDFNAWMAGGNDLALVAGTQVWCQYWSRDGGAEFQTNLGNALSFTIAP